ncbi:MAG: hypothetical protein MUO50_14470 [Longimicrobiales bacterium]|nr:hypothetical protein [Longimicrobiales bacterium]
MKHTVTAPFSVSFGTILALLCSGCVSTKQIQRTDWGAIPSGQKITVTVLDGTRSNLSTAAVYQDHLEGTVLDQDLAADVRIPLDSIEYIEIRRVNLGPVVVLAAGVAAGVVIGAALGKDDTRPLPRPEPPSSCPLVYSFDGSDYVLDSETFSGALAQGLERVDLDNLEHLAESDGHYRLLLANERLETQYTDELALLAVDHPVGTWVLPDSRGILHLIEDLRSPLSARGLRGEDALDAVMLEDERKWTGAPVEEADLSVDADLRDGLVLTFDRPAGATAYLVVRALNTPLAPFALEQFLELQGDQLVPWYRQVKTDPGLRRRFQEWVEREGLLQVSLYADDQWVPQGSLRDVGPNLPKTQVALLDLSAVSAETVSVKLEAARGLWAVDRVTLGAGTPALQVAEGVTLEGAVTRDGRDVSASLRAADGAYHTALEGDTVELTFTAQPPPGPGMARSFLLRTQGFYHIQTRHSGPPRTELAERILAEPLFGNRFLLLRWRALHP